MSQSKMEKSVVLGVCAMAKKTRSQPMQEILLRLVQGDRSRIQEGEARQHRNGLVILIFREEMILNDPVDQWPIVHGLIAWPSKGFPLQKVMEFVDIREREGSLQWCANDLNTVQLLFDRRVLFRALHEHRVPTMEHLVVDSDRIEVDQVVYDDAGLHVGGQSANERTITGNGEQVGGHLLRHPFVEKPSNADDHQVRVYYDRTQGKVCEMHRKTFEKSSVFIKGITDVRSNGVFVYEPFLQTRGQDIKVYAMDGYAYAESRKVCFCVTKTREGKVQAPTVDGKVERDEFGMECREQVQLTEEEKAVAARVYRIFGQAICGFDILRVPLEDGSTRVSVCDVNGWSFVKKRVGGSCHEFYEHCAEILFRQFMDALDRGKRKEAKKKEEIDRLLDVTEVPVYMNAVLRLE